MEWIIKMKHQELGDTISIIGYGEDPHHPVEIHTQAKGTEGKRILKKIKDRVSLGPASNPDAAIVESANDMYLWLFSAAHFAAGWDLKENLPKIETPPAPDFIDGNLVVY